MKTTIINSITAVVLTGLFVFFVFALVAGLDEFARVPFYDALPVAATILGVVSLLLVARRTQATNVIGRIRAPILFVNTIWRPLVNRVGGVFQSVKLRFANTSDQFQTSHDPSAEEIDRAWAKVHSIASGFSLMPRAFENVSLQGKNYEDHRNAR